jgi:anti-sigma B factor antagonist
MSTDIPADFAVTAGRLDDAYVVAPVGELDLGTVNQVSALIAERPAGCDVLVLDLRGLTFFDTSGMRLVVETLEEAGREALGFALVRGPEAVHRLFALARIDDRLPFVDDPRDAIGRG